MILQCKTMPQPGWETVNGLLTLFQFLVADLKIVQYTKGPNKPFWKRQEWAVHISAFSTVPTIHIHFLQYVVFPPFSVDSATNTLQPWAKNIGEAPLNTIAISVHPVYLGQSVLHQHIAKIDSLEEAQAKGLLPSTAESVDGFDDGAGVYLYYDLRKAEGNWVVDMDGEQAAILGKQFGDYSYYAGAHMDSYVDWLREQAYQNDLYVYDTNCTFIFGIYCMLS